MNTLCFATNLTSAEWASWVQAIGTIVAVVAASAIAIWQSRAQHKNALALLRAEQRHSREALAKTLLVLSRSCTKVVKHFTEQMNDRESVYKIACGEKYLDLGELQAIQNATSSVPLYSLPDSLVTHAMVLAATIRQFRQTVDKAIQLHRTIDAANYEEIFKLLRKMNESLELTCGDIESAVQDVQRDA